jgi:hypothetical protein
MILSDYGWVLGDISFVVVLSLKLIGQLMGFDDQPIFGVVDDQVIFNGAIFQLLNNQLKLTCKIAFQRS